MRLCRVLSCPYDCAGCLQESASACRNLQEYGLDRRLQRCAHSRSQLMRAATPVGSAALSIHATAPLSFAVAPTSCVCGCCLSVAAPLQDRDAIVKGLKAQIKNAIAQSGGQPQAKIMEPVLNQPNAAFEFAFKIRVRSCCLVEAVAAAAAAHTHCGMLEGCCMHCCRLLSSFPAGWVVLSHRRLLPCLLLRGPVSAAHGSGCCSYYATCCC